MICNVIKRPGGLVSRRIFDWKRQILVLLAKNLILAAVAFQKMKCSSKSYHIWRIINNKGLKLQHQWELKSRKTEHLEIFKVGKTNGVKSIVVTELYLNHVRGVRGIPFDYVIRQPTNVRHISP